MAKRSSAEPDMTEKLCTPHWFIMTRPLDGDKCQTALGGSDYGPETTLMLFSTRANAAWYIVQAGAEKAQGERWTVGEIQGWGNILAFLNDLTETF